MYRASMKVVSLSLLVAGINTLLLFLQYAEYATEF